MSEYSKLVKEVAIDLSNYYYMDNLQATKELMELFDTISLYPLYSAKDYVRMYDDSFFYISDMGRFSF